MDRFAVDMHHDGMTGTHVEQQAGSGVVRRYLRASRRLSRLPPRPRAALQALWQGLMTAGGPLFLSDFFTREERCFTHRSIRFIANMVRRLRLSRETVELGDWLNDCVKHAFVKGEIESELKEAGFDPVVFAVSPIDHPSRLAHAVGIALPEAPRPSRAHGTGGCRDPRQPPPSADEPPLSQ